MEDRTPVVAYESDGVNTFPSAVYFVHEDQLQQLFKPDYGCWLKKVEYREAVKIIQKWGLVEGA